MKLRRPLRGSERGADVRMVQRALNKWVGGKPSVRIPVSGVYDQRTSDRVMAFQAWADVKPADGSLEQSTLTKLEPFFDLWGRFRYASSGKKPVPELGPVILGGRTVLDHDLTHATGGLRGYPAFDDGFEQAGVAVLAPETLTVTNIGGTVRRDGRPNGRSVYATGKSGIRYWFGHVENPALPGSRVGKGGKLAVISGNHEVPHVHVGVNARKLTRGRDLEHNTDYTHGATPVGQQLRAL